MLPLLLRSVPAPVPDEGATVTGTGIVTVTTELSPNLLVPDLCVCSCFGFLSFFYFNAFLFLHRLWLFHPLQQPSVLFIYAGTAPVTVSASVTALCACLLLRFLPSSFFYCYLLLFLLWLRLLLPFLQQYLLLFTLVP